MLLVFYQRVGSVRPMPYRKHKEMDIGVEISRQAKIETQINPDNFILLTLENLSDLKLANR